MKPNLSQKDKLYVKGVVRAKDFCELNDVDEPKFIKLYPKDSEYHLNSCAFYRDHIIKVMVKKCAAIGKGGAAWSYPGYFIDRTPFGVIAHELGHHVDYMSGEPLTGPYSSEMSSNIRKEACEGKLTNYCPNDAEWFAEMFRLFVTNSDLLKDLRPRTYKMLRDKFYPVESRYWGDVLVDAPERNLNQIRKRIRNV